MAQLAIIGHKTRGNEVIEILEMLGGKTRRVYTGTEGNWIYALKNGNIIGDFPCDGDNCIIFTLEEFLEKYPYKVGNKVQHKDATYCDTIYEVDKMSWVDDHVEYTVKHFWYNNCYNKMTVKDLQPYKEYKEETVEERKYADLRLDVDQDDKLATEVTIGGDKITSPENYLIGKVTTVDNGLLVEFVKKQPQYPKTYEECCKVLFPNSIALGKILTSGYNCELLKKLGELLICRNAYWKIIGEQMGLGKPWEPDWSNLSVTSHEFIKINNGRFIYSSRVLVFPTLEICDTFYENFKELIEACKDFL